MSSKKPGERYTIAVDFDGVLHRYDSPWVSADVIPDPPVAGAVEWLNEICHSFAVVIFTTRGESESGVAAVRRWLEDNGVTWGSYAVVTDKKPPALVYIDDRGWRFDGTFPTAQEVHSARPWNK